MKWLPPIASPPPIPVALHNVCALIVGTGFLDLSPPPPLFPPRTARCTYSSITLSSTSRRRRRYTLTHKKITDTTSRPSAVNNIHESELGGPLSTGQLLRLPFHRPFLFVFMRGHKISSKLKLSGKTTWISNGLSLHHCYRDLERRGNGQ